MITDKSLELSLALQMIDVRPMNNLFVGHRREQYQFEIDVHMWKDYYFDEVHDIFIGVFDKNTVLDKQNFLKVVYKENQKYISTYLVIYKHEKELNDLSVLYTDSVIPLSGGVIDIAHKSNFLNLANFDVSCLIMGGSDADWVRLVCVE